MTGPPTGTVTFLFTDIEGSTKMWERHPEAMRSALSRHDDILRETIEERGGYVFKTVGDGFCAAFPTAHEATEAALGAQRAQTSLAVPLEGGEAMLIDASSGTVLLRQLKAAEPQRCSARSSGKARRPTPRSLFDEASRRGVPEPFLR